MPAVGGKGLFSTHFCFLQPETQNRLQSQLGGAATLVRQVIEFVRVYNPEKPDLFVCPIFRQTISCSVVSALFSILSVAVEVLSGVFQKICQYCDHWVRCYCSWAFGSDKDGTAQWPLDGFYLGNVYSHFTRVFRQESESSLRFLCSFFFI